MKFRTDIEDYDELRVVVRRIGEELGSVRIVSPMGEWEDSFKLPVSSQDVRQALASTLPRTRAYQQVIEPGGMFDPVREMGGNLFSALFVGRGEGLYRRSLDSAQEQGKGLRLRLGTDDPELAAMPWEFLHDGKDFINLFTRSPVVRTSGVVRSLSSQPTTTQLRVLVVTADVGVRANMQPGEDIRRLQELEAVFPQLELTIVQDTTLPQLFEVVQGESFHVLHLIGTGTSVDHGRQALVFKDGEGRQAVVHADELGDIVKGKQELRLVFLSACETERLANELAKEVPAVLGMYYEITPPACSVFTEGLYSAVLAGQPLEVAVTKGRQEIDIQNPGSREWGLPVFYMHASSGELLARQPETTDQAPPPEIKKAPLDDPDRRREWEKTQYLLNVHLLNLHALEERKESYKGAAPPSLESEIIEVRSRVRELEAQLEEIASNAQE